MIFARNAMSAVRTTNAWSKCVPCCTCSPGWIIPISTSESAFGATVIPPSGGAGGSRSVSLPTKNTPRSDSPVFVIEM